MPVSQKTRALLGAARYRWIILVMVAALVLTMFSLLTAAETPMDRTGTITVSDANIRVGPGTTSYNASFTIIATLHNGDPVRVIGVETGQYISGWGDDWYHIIFELDGEETEGYVVAGFVTLNPVPTTTIPTTTATTTIPTTTETVETTAVESSETTDAVEPSETMETSATTSGDETQTSETTQTETEATTVETTVDFEALLESEGFPESYKTGLRALHEQHPDWTFQALHTNLDWNTVINNENAPGRSLISTSHDGYKSTDDVAYNWLTNTWRAFDGSSWVMASKAVISYYSTFPPGKRYMNLEK